MTQYLIEAATVRNSATGEVDPALVGQSITVVERGTTTPVPILEVGTLDPIPGSALVVTSAFTLPPFILDSALIGTAPEDLYIDWDDGSAKSGPIGFEAVMREIAIAARDAAEAALPAELTLVAAALAPILGRTLDYTITSGDSNLLEIRDGAGDVIMALNEWGALRGYPRAYAHYDSLVRAILVDGQSGAGNGNAFEIDDRRTGRVADKLFGVRWLDGRMVQGDQLVGAVFLLNVWETVTDIPSTLPPGTVIAQKED